MKSKKMSPIVTTNRLAEVKEFYQSHFGFRVVFEGKGYLALRSEGDTVELSFMLPDSEEQPLFEGGGLTYCFEVENVDAEYDRLSTRGVTIVQPLVDQPWGDRCFIVLDPLGIALYIHRPGEPAEEFKQYFVE